MCSIWHKRTFNWSRRKRSFLHARFKIPARAVEQVVFSSERVKGGPHSLPSGTPRGSSGPKGWLPRQADGPAAPWPDVCEPRGQGRKTERAGEPHAGCAAPKRAQGEERRGEPRAEKQTNAATTTQATGQGGKRGGATTRRAHEHGPGARDHAAQGGEAEPAPTTGARATPASRRQGRRRQGGGNAGQGARAQSQHPRRVGRPRARPKGGGRRNALRGPSGGRRRGTR